MREATMEQGVTVPKGIGTDVESLTRAAFEAAHMGLWDVVTSLYKRRAECLAAHPLDAGMAEQVLAMDRVVQEHIRVSREALHESMQQAAISRRTLARFKRRIGSVKEDGGRVDRLA